MVLWLHPRACMINERSQEGKCLVKPNYSAQKRRRELDRKKKKEEKRQKRLEKKLKDTEDEQVTEDMESPEEQD